MGLDNMAAIRNIVSSDDISTKYEYLTMSRDAFEEVPNCLVGGMLSGHGQGPSIRGKVYAEFVRHITGVDLYQEIIDENVVQHMATRLQGFIDVDPNEGRLRRTWGMSRDEALALAKWFSVVAQHKGVVLGWW